MPYISARYRSISAIYNPSYCPYLGPIFFHPPGSKQHTIYSREKKIIYDIVAEMPKTSFMNIKCHPEFDNGLPFFWKNFSLEASFTYIINGSHPLDEIYNKFSSKIKQHIRYAEKTFIADDAGTGEDLAKLLEKRYKHKKITNFLSLDQTASLIDGCIAKGQGSTYFMKNSNGELVAGIFLVWDAKNVYYLMGAVNDNTNHRGANAWLLWKAMQKLMNGKRFDFEGSTIPNIRKYFSSFGGTPSPVTNLVYYKNRWVKLLRSL